LKRIIEVQAGKLLAAVRELFTEYARDLKIDLCFQNFDRELAELPGQYAPPRGRLWLALVEGAAAGCVALRPNSDEICEMKRLYVRPAFRRSGTGRALAHTAVGAAKQLGYHSMRLDTLSAMTEAIALYQSLGFHRIVPYYDNPCEEAAFMELKLR
jgi:putative acetyltransferase